MNDIPRHEWLQNVTYDELQTGQSARLLRTLTLADIQAFAAVSGDTNPAHLDAEYADQTLFHGVIAHGMWSGALISALLGTQFPGPGTIYLEQQLRFSRPVRIGDTLVVTVTVLRKDDEKKQVELACEVSNQKGARVLDGVARVLAPTRKVRIPRPDVPRIQLFDPDARHRALLALGGGIEAATCAVVHPCDAESLTGALEAAAAGLIVPVLVGPEPRIRHVAGEAGVALDGVRIVHAAHGTAAADAAAAMAEAGEVEMLMKGSLPTDQLIRAVLARPALRTGRRMSHVFRFDVALYPKPLLITDAALNIGPSLPEKVDIIQNAIDFARLIGVAEPKVALLCATETVNPAIQSTLDAAVLCKMADRGQIRGGRLDGPLAFDSAISTRAAEITQVHGDVAGDADILVVPEVESGNMLAKQLEHLAGASGAGLVVGARVPIALTNRADGPRARVASALLALLAANNARRDRPRQVWPD